MAADTTPPRAPVFRCAECEAVWRTQAQRDRCCTAKPETVQQPTDPYVEANRRSVEAFERDNRQPETTDLPAALRVMAGHIQALSSSSPNGPVLEAAAAEIERLRAENARLRAALAEYERAMKAGGRGGG